jgi:hypothetical protein
MRYVTVAIRSLLGLIFLASGLNGFLHRFPNPAMLAAVSFFSALLHSHYMLPLLCTTEVIGGVLLLAPKRLGGFALGRRWLGVAIPGRVIWQHLADPFAGANRTFDDSSRAQRSRK